MSDLSDETAALLMRYVLPQGGPPLLLFAEVRHAGGAIAKVDLLSAAYGNREAMHSLQMVGAAPTPEIHATVRGQIYLNFLEGEEGVRSFLVCTTFCPVLCE